jgi:transposase
LDVAVHRTDEQFGLTTTRPAGESWRLEQLQARGIGIEASSGYERGSMSALLAAGLPVSLVNPWKRRRFAHAAVVLAKKIIPRFIAIMRAVKCTATSLRSSGHNRTQRQLVHAVQQISCPIEQLRDPACAAWWLEHNVYQFDQLTVRAIEASPTLSVRRDLLCSPVRLGRVLAATLIALLPELGSVPNPSIPALVGLVPCDFDSGRWKGCAATSAAGRRPARSLPAAQVAAGLNPTLKAFRQRPKAAGKKP